MIRYLGVRLPDGKCLVWRISESGRLHHLASSRRRPRHPSRDWEWGYSGTGPADLAWSLMADLAYSREVCDGWHQSLKRDVIARLPREDWLLNEEVLRCAIAQLMVQEAPDADEVLHIWASSPPAPYVAPDLTDDDEIPFGR